MRILQRTLLDELAAKAALSPRARAHSNIHDAPSDLVQRFVVVALGDSYFRPHRHAGRSELATVLRGRFDVLTFDERGRVQARYAVGDGTGSIAYETPRGTWHTLVPDAAAGGAFLEIKEGPYDPATATEFAAWAPEEGATGVRQFLEWLRAAQPGDLPSDALCQGATSSPRYRPS
ncbi:MAG TPA: WbuC family cupin fold metalloprotein [Steroidobacteraceae bacterium]|nr:WbuC family cupin fold metalloprotein [Steroidobacteraceae bacterium]